MLTVTATLPVLLLASTFCNYYSLPVVLLSCAPCAAPCAVPATHAVPNGFVTLLVLRLACLSDIKVVFWHVLERHNLQVSVSWYKLVT